MGMTRLTPEEKLLLHVSAHAWDGEYRIASVSYTHLDVYKRQELSHPYFNGVQKAYWQFLNELVNEKVLAPDWYTIEWENSKSYTHNDKLGMVWYPAGALYAEYCVQVKQEDVASCDIWDYWHDAPLEGGKYGANGNPGFMWGFATSKFQDEGKLKRVAHMIDTMTAGGENYFQSIQGSCDEVYDCLLYTSFVCTAPTFATSATGRASPRTFRPFPPT